MKKQHDVICVVVCVFLCVSVRGVIRTVQLSHLIAALLLIASPQLLFTCNLTYQDATTSLHISPLWTNDFLSLFSSLFFSFILIPPSTMLCRNYGICVHWSTVKATHSAQWKSTHISICLHSFLSLLSHSLSSYLASFLSILDQTNKSCRHWVVAQSVWCFMSVSACALVLLLSRIRLRCLSFTKETLP